MNTRSALTGLLLIAVGSVVANLLVITLSSVVLQFILNSD